MIIFQFMVSFISIIGFAVLFNIPQKSIPKAALAGALGWVSYVHIHNISDSKVAATFIGACIVALISEVFARRFKEAVTVFVIPAILPLVPGSGMYYTMLAIIDNDYTRFASVSSETIFIAGSIAAAILIISSLTRMVVYIKEIFTIKYNKLKMKML